MTYRKISLMLLALCFLSVPARADIIWHWQGQFTSVEKQKLKSWITQTAAAVEDTVAPYPFDVHIYFHRLMGRGEPVPWANTQRRPNQAVHFHVDPTYSEQAFLQDWTAPHELSHLLIPFVGHDYSWFAEGFASYMQYQVMQTLGVLNAGQVTQRYKNKISSARNKYLYHKIPFHYAAQILRESKQYPVYYWGGAAFFMAIDKQLNALDSSLVTVISDYVHCCRMETNSITELTKSLDGVVRSNLFTEHLQQAQVRPGFPTLHW